MIFILYSYVNEESIEKEIGLPDYSYYFVLEKYRTVLETLGEVIVVKDPNIEVDKIYHRCCDNDEHCVFLSFTPPHKTTMGLDCPTIPVFAWEYSTIPTEAWKQEEKNDWRIPLGQFRWAITHSQFAINAVRKAMRKEYPIISVPAPLWDDYSIYFDELEPPPPITGFELTLKPDNIIDSQDYDFANKEYIELEERILEYENDKKTEEQNILPQDSNQDRLEKFTFTGVIYTSVLSPLDGRKNWMDLVWAFCWAFRDTEDATLILKITHNDTDQIKQLLLEELNKLSPFKCHVIAICGYLDSEQYNALLKGTMYTVNSAFGEGQCLPLMEYMSAGKPAIAPDHTAMKDYINPDCAFVVRSSEEWNHWPHDPRLVFRALRYRIDWESLKDAYLDSYNVFKNNPSKYKTMSQHATQALKNHCSREIAQEKLSRFFELHQTVTRAIESPTLIQKETEPQGTTYRLKRALGLC